jgi:hypothetical protein
LQRVEARDRAVETDHGLMDRATGIDDHDRAGLRAAGLRRGVGLDRADDVRRREKSCDDKCSYDTRRAHHPVNLGCAATATADTTGVTGTDGAAGTAGAVGVSAAGAAGAAKTVMATETARD